MPQNPDIQYIRVRHLGETTGSLHIDDLDTEANKKQPHQVPVYIPEGGSVDLPLNDQVLLSFNQGTLRSFINQGLASGFVIQDDGSAEVWVNPDGSDDNPGTRSAPFASIQYAIDTLVKRAGHGIQKNIFLMARGVFSESVIIATRNIAFIGGVGDVRGVTGHDRSTKQTTWHNDDSDKSTVTITSMTKEAVNAWYSDGGFTYTIDGSDYSFTGAATDGRDIWFTPNTGGGGIIARDLHANITFTGIRFNGFNDENNSQIAIIPATQNGDNGYIRGVSFITCEITSNTKPAIFAKNVFDLRLTSTNITNKTVLDGLRGFTSSRGEKSGQLSNTTDIALINGDLIVVGRSFAAEPGQDPAAFLGGELSVKGNLQSFGNIEFSASDSVSGAAVKSFGVGTSAQFNNTASAGSENNPAQLSCAGLVYNSSSDSYLKDLFVAEDCVCSLGAITVNGGTIKGNLTVNTPATATLINVIVEGNITGTGTVVQNGGGYLGTNDVSTYTHNALKTT